MNQAEVNACLGETGNPRHTSVKGRLYYLVIRTTGRQKVGMGDERQDRYCNFL